MERNAREHGAQPWIRLILLVDAHHQLSTPRVAEKVAMTMADLAVDREKEREGWEALRASAAEQARMNIVAGLVDATPALLSQELVLLFERSIEPAPPGMSGWPGATRATPTARRRRCPALTALIEAACARDARRTGGALPRRRVWLAPTAPRRWSRGGRRGHMGIAARADLVGPAPAARRPCGLRWTGDDGARGAIVVEVRRGLIVFAASL